MQLARLRGADGAQTGEALAEVEAHVADSGQTPQEAFGDPRAYAESVLPRERALDRRSVIGAILVGVAGYLGAGGVLSAATSWGGEVPIRLGAPVAILVLAVTCWVIAQTFSALVRSKNRAALPVALALALAVTVLAGVLLPQPVATLPRRRSRISSARSIITGSIASRSSSDTPYPVKIARSSGSDSSSS